MRAGERLTQRRHRRAPVHELFPAQGQRTEKEYFALPDANRYI